MNVKLISFEVKIIQTFDFGIRLKNILKYKNSQGTMVWALSDYNVFIFMK